MAYVPSTSWVIANSRVFAFTTSTSAGAAATLYQDLCKVVGLIDSDLHMALVVA